jgi:hypothetical protein
MNLTSSPTSGPLCPSTEVVNLNSVKGTKKILANATTVGQADELVGQETGRLALLLYCTASLIASVYTASPLPDTLSRTLTARLYESSMDDALKRTLGDEMGHG